VAAERYDVPQDEQRAEGRDEREDPAVSVHTWIVVGDDPAIGNLITVARSLGGQVAAVVAGPRPVAETVAASDVDKVVWCGAQGDAPVEAYATAVADAIAAEQPGVVLGGRRPGERVLLGAAAARLGAAVLTGASLVSAENGDVIVVNAVFGGVSEETVAVSGPVALMLDGGQVPAASGTVPIEEPAAVPLGMKVLETKTSAVDQVDLAAAPRVVGIGRGLKAQQDLVMIEALAQAVRAEIACSRPVAEGLNWLGKERYIGSSGQHIAPQLYFAIGISGQLQHMVGVHGAETIVAINSDPNAPVFADADYGLVGDLYKIVPAITGALK
jgi:electron transfer flavoprotein alpha subunit